MASKQAGFTLKPLVLAAIQAFQPPSIFLRLGVFRLATASEVTAANGCKLSAIISVAHTYETRWMQNQVKNSITFGKKRSSERKSLRPTPSSKKTLTYCLSQRFFMSTWSKRNSIEVHLPF